MTDQTDISPETPLDKPDAGEISGNKDGRWKRLWKQCQKLFLWFNIAYVIIFLIVLYSLEYNGDSGVILSLLLYLPAWGWTLPSLVLIPLCLIIKARLTPIHILTVGFVLWLYMGYQFGLKEPAVQPDVTVVSYNYGQRHGTEVDDFVSQVNADVIAFQEAPARVYKYRARYPDYFTADLGQFLVVSRFPVGAASLVALNDGTNDPVAARFEVAHSKRRFALYVVHLPTPRQEFMRLRSSRLGGLVPNRKLLSRDGRQRYLDYLDLRRGLAKEILRQVENDPLPCLLVGDFNTPPHGVVYHSITDKLVDAFEEAGDGYGYTFPGDAFKRYAFEKPWLRIDYIFYSESWQAVDFITEKGRKTQHLAIAAKLVFSHD